MLNELTNREAVGRGVGCHFRGQRAEPALVLTRGPRLRCGRANEAADPTTRFENAGAFEVGVDPGHCVGVDTEVHGQLPYGRQLVADFETTRCNRGTQPAIGAAGVPQVGTPFASRNDGPRPCASLLMLNWPLLRLRSSLSV